MPISSCEGDTRGAVGPVESTEATAPLPQQDGRIKKPESTPSAWPSGHAAPTSKLQHRGCRTNFNLFAYEVAYPSLLWAILHGLL